MIFEVEAKISAEMEKSEETQKEEVPPRKKRRLGKPLGKGVSSFKVFNHFVYEEEGEEVDVSQVFSQDCFKLWLSTRNSSIKHPEQSFQRALYAHLRGADGRKPFSEPVEAALLKELRFSTQQGKTNPWEKVFGRNDLKMGVKGFKQDGFHEKKRNERVGGIKGGQVSQTSSNYSLPLPTLSPQFVPLFSNFLQQSKFDMMKPVGRIVLDHSLNCVEQDENALKMLKKSVIGTNSSEWLISSKPTDLVSLPPEQVFASTGQCWSLSLLKTGKNEEIGVFLMYKKFEMFPDPTNVLGVAFRTVYLIQDMNLA